MGANKQNGLLCVTIGSSSGICEKNMNCQVNTQVGNTGRFMMFSMITNIYKKKTKGPILMQLFTATEKLKKYLLTTRGDGHLNPISTSCVFNEFIYLFIYNLCYTSRSS
jgi:hypothetical protein